MKTNLTNFFLAIAAALLFAACGGSETGGTPGESAATASDAQSASPAEQGMSTSDENPGGACKLLTREQVDTVIPGNDGGQVRDASEAALLTDVDIEFCRYFHIEGMDMKYLDLLVYRASSDAGFEQISIGKWAHQGSSRALDIGDVGFLLDMSEQNEMVATASKGKTVFELKLNAEDAAAKSEQLIDLARIVGKEI